MKMLMTTDSVGGVWTYALELARALAPHGVRVTLAKMGAALLPAQRREAAEIPALDLRESLYRLEWQNDPWADVDRAGAWLMRLAAEIRPDVVHLNGYAHATLPWQAPVVVVAHSCVRTWWRSVRREDPPASWRTYTDRVGAGLCAASLVVAPTAALVDAMRREYAWPGEPARVIPNGRDPSLFRVAGKEPLILTAGRLWDEAKNVAAVCAAAGKVPWRVVAAGDTQDSSAGAGGTGGVEFLGRLSPPLLAEWMSRAAIFTLPARYEPFGLATLEAALSGCALVLGDIPSLREVWGDAALYVDPESSDELATALGVLCTDEVLRTTFAKVARQRALRYGADRMGRAYLQAYRALQAEALPDAPRPVAAPGSNDNREASCAS